jgi:hypothetical protein
MTYDLKHIAHALGGEISNGQAIVPGPGHSAADRSLAIKLDSNAPEGFLAHSFAGDDPIECRDYVRRKAGLPAWKPHNGHRRAIDDAIERALKAAATAQSNGKPKKVVATYDYTHENGALLYQAVRYEPKDFRQRRPDGNGGWVWELGDVRRVPYRSPELLRFPDATGLHLRRRERRGSRRLARTLRHDCGERQMDG